MKVFTSISTKILLFIISLNMLTEASILEIQELYNPSINQTIILMGDIHIDCQVQDDKQCKTIAKNASRYNAHNIIEYNEAFKHTPILITKLYDELTSRKISVEAIDFRVAISYLWSIITKSIGLNETYEQAYSYWHNPEIAAYIFNSFERSFENRIAIRDQIEAFLNSVDIKDKAFIEYLNKILKEGRTLSEFVAKALPVPKKDQQEEINSVIDFLFNNTFIKKDNNIEINPENIIDKLFQSDIDLFDALIIENIYKFKNKRVLFIIIGQTHLLKISGILQSFGFNLKNKLSTYDEFQSVYEKVISQQGHLESPRQSHLFDKYCLPLDNFFKQSTTLPKYFHRYYFWLTIIFICSCLLLIAYCYSVKR